MSVTTTTLYADTLAKRKFDSLWQSVLATVRIWRQRARQRRKLAQLTYVQLQDIGITHAEAWREVNKPFWQQ